MITITDAARKQLAEVLAAQEGSGHSLRLAIAGRGPQGFEYELTLLRADEKSTEDMEVESGALSVLVDAASADNLRGATLDPAGAHLTIRAIFGGGLLVVPDDWQVDLRVIGIMGGVGDGRDARGRQADGPRLVVDGFALFGGFGITSRPPDTVD
jgi:iron-sulfur cluster assembly accessory protein